MVTGAIVGSIVGHYIKILCNEATCRSFQVVLDACSVSGSELAQEKMK